MQTHQSLSPALMMKFAKRQSAALRCIRCGQWFQLSFSGGRLTERRCGCGRVHGGGATAGWPSIDDGNAKPPVRPDAAELDA